MSVALLDLTDLDFGGQEVHNPTAPVVASAAAGDVPARRGPTTAGPVREEAYRVMDV